jgi:PAS domain S-box-containing protein
MTYYDGPHDFDEEEVELSLNIARQIGLGIERKQAEARLRVRVTQQREVALLGEAALRRQDLQLLFGRATLGVADTLGVEYCKVLELLPGGRELLLRDGVGWREGLAGKATVSAGLESQAGYTLLSDEPVVVRDLRQEKRFSGPPLLLEHGVVSGMSCIIRGTGGKPWGVLGAHSRRPIGFTLDDVAFLQSVANLLGSAIQRRDAEEGLRNSEERFRSLVSIITDVPWGTDAQGGFVKPQLAWQAYTGQTWEEHRGFGWVHAIHPENRERVQQLWKEACANASLYQSEGRLWHAATKEWRYFVARAAPLRNADGSVREWVGTCTDVDDQKRSQERLETIVSERTVELQEANAALLRDMEERKKLQEQLLQAQKMETIGVLAGGIAHEFNNILNIVQAYTFILRGQAGENRQVGEGLGVIDKTVQRGSGLVQQLLTLARKSSADLESINVNHLVEGLIPLIRQTFPKTIEVSASLQTGLPPIIADRNQIEQALLNLCLNARDALPDGGEVSFETRCVPGSAVQHLGGLTAARYVCIAVRDNGTGIADAVRSRMFEPFVTTKESGQGAGLGLSVVYGIVKSHEGLIDVESAAGAGAVFRLYFPAEAADEAQRPQFAPNGKNAGGAITVLVVEDERIMLHVLETTLSQAGYNVLTAADGAAAVETYCRHKGEIALAVLDMGLPKVMGRDVLLRFKEENPALKVVVVSGYLEADVEMESRWDGLRFLHKPYMLDELVQTIQTLLAT